MYFPFSLSCTVMARPCTSNSEHLKFQITVSNHILSFSYTPDPNRSGFRPHQFLHICWALVVLCILFAIGPIIHHFNICLAISKNILCLFFLSQVKHLFSQVTCKPFIPKASILSILQYKYISPNLCFAFSTLWPFFVLSLVWSFPDSFQISFIRIQIGYLKQKASISYFLKKIEIINKVYSQVLFPN